MTNIIVPVGLSDREMIEYENEFRRAMLEGLKRRLAGHGIRKVGVIGTSRRGWEWGAQLGDGTPVMCKTRVEELTKYDPSHDMAEPTFFEFCCGHVARKLLAVAEALRNPPKPLDHVKAGRLPTGDGLTYLELGSELAHVMGDAAYELDAELRGEKELSDPTRATNLNPESSTPR